MVIIEIKNTLDQTSKTIKIRKSILSGNDVVIGRAKGSQVQLNENSVSRKHATITLSRGQLMLTDIGSTRGTFFKDAQLSPNKAHKLQLGEVYTIGPFEIIFLNPKVDSDKTILVNRLPGNYQPVALVKEDAWEVWPGKKTNVVCTNIIDETHDVKTFVFAAQPNTLFRYQPGQFATLHLKIDGKRVTRCYTLSSTPSRPHTITHTIKRTAAAGNHPPGQVSNWLHDNLKIGHSIEISAPGGSFSCHSHPADRLCLISGGSGITPMLSMTRWLCDTAAKVNIVFIHVAKTEKDIIARNELESLSEHYRNLRLVFTLTRSNDSNRWSGYSGRLSNELLKHAVPDLDSRRIFVCGPSRFMLAMKSQLKENGFPMDRYLEESFGGRNTNVDSMHPIGTAKEPSPPQFGLQAVMKNLNPQPDKAQAEVAKNLYNASPENQAALSNKVTFTKSGITVDSNGETILESAESNGLTLPFSCRQGICGTCRTIKISGAIQQDGYNDDVLSDDDKKAGYILLCIGKPIGPIEVDA